MKLKFGLRLLTALAVILLAAGLDISGILAGSCDLNSDGYVNSGDVSIVGSHYNQKPTGAVNYDINGDHKVNIIDLSIEAKYYGIRCKPSKKCNYK